MARMLIVKAGMLATVQARPRFGWQHLGVPPGGAMDDYSFRVANLIVGNDAEEAALEVTLLGPELEFDSQVTIAVCGADLTAQTNGSEIPKITPVDLAAGARVRFGARRSGARAYVAVRGGIDAPVVLGSRTTSLSGALPGLAGRALRAGDELQIGNRTVGNPRRVDPAMWSIGEADAAVRFIPGPDIELFGAESRDAFETGEYRISVQSNRMGYRLEGPMLKPVNAGTLLSEATPIGSIQVPPSGLPILLMADRQTTGGYPRIGTVITADLPIAGQLAPGDRLRFARATEDQAIAALGAREQMLEWLRSAS